ncbi:MAG: response regulator transcription factor [Ignavibacteria bacterium]|jgi:two-component system alkaline phosphatase synthesis response regulator PhoP|nr:response regulator transcription factor [Ignavibacteria bacterium]MCU7519359.1 response regulator transcription factor [Ignavibacteria bacterium]HEX2961403.1 response regulator transcription factor [Ignavibacteriales bacterium]
MKAKILLADDEKDIVEFLEYNLALEGFDVITAYDGKEALEKLSQKPDLIILDVMMPKFDGFEVCRQIRKNEQFSTTPVIFLTAKSSEVDEIKGLELGADDFIGKPISPKKLVARVKSNLRKSELQASEGTSLPAGENPVIKIGPLEINRDKYEVLLEGETIIFPRKEFEILSYLASKPGKVFGREAILHDIWGTDVLVVDRTIDVHIRKIREKLTDYADMIETIKGVGYRFRNPA